MSALPKLLEETRQASSRLGEARTEARGAAVMAIRKLELTLVDALAGETLKGLPDLGGRTYGARVRGKHDGQLVGGHVALVIRPDGTLGLMDGGSVDRNVEDGELMVEDVEDLAAKVEIVLRGHLVAAERGAVRYKRLQWLAVRLHDLLEAGV